VNATQWLDLAVVVYLVGSAVAATLAWREERDLRAEFPDIRYDVMLVVCVGIGTGSWLSVLLIWFDRKERSEARRRFCRRKAELAAVAKRNTETDANFEKWWDKTIRRELKERHR
jgi:hypothetical protein